MNKEYLKKLEYLGDYTIGDCRLKDHKYYKELYKYLAAIDNSNSTEVLECLEEIEQKLECSINGGLVLLKEDEIKINTIKQALLKYQGLEKENLLFKNIHNTKVKTPLVSIFEGLSKEERFKFTEHIYYHWEEMKEALEEQNEQLTKENIELKKKLNKTHIMWDDLTFSKETTYIKATLNNVVVTLECWLEGKKEWCRANFNNAPCNNIVFVHHGYDDETDTQTTIFNALGFVRV